MQMGGRSHSGDSPGNVGTLLPLLTKDIALMQENGLFRIIPCEESMPATKYTRAFQGGTRLSLGFPELKRSPKKDCGKLLIRFRPIGTAASGMSLRSWSGHCLRGDVRCDN